MELDLFGKNGVDGFGRGIGIGDVREKEDEGLELLEGHFENSSVRFRFPILPYIGPQGNRKRMGLSIHAFCRLGDWGRFLERVAKSGRGDMQLDIVRSAVDHLRAGRDELIANNTGPQRIELITNLNDTSITMADIT